MYSAYMAHRVGRRLTDRQVAVLAAVERLGRPTLPEIAAEFPDLERSTVLRVLIALIDRDLVGWRGNWSWVYFGVGGGDKPPVDEDEVVRFQSAPLRR